MDSEIRLRIDEIRKRVQEYQRHKHDPYSYYPEEINAVRELKNHAVEDLEFLIAQLDQKH